MNKIKPKWVIFDVGGVLYHFSKSIAETAKHLEVSEKDLLRAYFVNFREEEVGKKHYKERVKEMLAFLKKDHDADKIIQLLFNKETYITDTRQLVKELHKSGYSLALLTNTWHGITGEITGQLEEFHLFNHVFDSTMLGLRKPEKEMFQHVKKTLKVAGEQILFVDDRMENIEAAKEFHWQTFLYDLGEDKGKKSNDQLRKILL